MKFYSYRNQEPQYDKSNFLAQGAIIIGNCTLSKNVNVWFNCVLRGDVNSIFIGENTNVQDLSMLHVTEKHPLVIEENVSIGHSVILHGCHIGAGSLIGMGAKILDGAKVGKNCLVASGSVIPPGKEYPEGSFIMGTPAKVIRNLSDEEIDQYSNHFKSYLKYAEDFNSEEHFKLI